MRYNSLPMRSALLALSAMIVFSLSATSAMAARQAEPKPKPNIVFILVDDLGIECLTKYGGRSHRTPNIDKLAEAGMRFSHCFSSPYCSPSRATLLTGRYPFKHGIKEVIYDVNRHKDLYLDTDQPSFARQLKAAGYATAIAGKWQLSFLHQRNEIQAFGFDTYQCWQIFNKTNQKTRRFHQPHFNRDGKVLSADIKDRFGPDVNVAFLTRFIQAHAKQGTPFLAYYTCLLPHFPWVPMPDSKDKSYVLPSNAHKGDPRYFPDMVRAMDQALGKLIKAIDDSPAADNTVVIFVADNGTQKGLNNTWKNGVVIPGGKGTMTDRGTRVPLIVRWPGRVKPGSVCDDLIDFSDFLPTLCAIAGAPLPEASIHGRSFLPQLLGRQGNPRTWVHIQDKHRRYLRTRDYILTGRGELRPVVDLSKDPAPSFDQNKPLPEAARKAKRFLQSVFMTLDG